MAIAGLEDRPGVGLPDRRDPGAGGLGVLTAVAMLTANDFWAKTGHDRFLAVNAFFEHLGLIAGLMLVSILSLRSQGA
jgi:uncharacterized membrane protein YphA (DoxX/SURF4 family)